MRKGKKASRHDAKKKSRRYVKAKTKCQHKVEEQCRKQARIRVKPNVKSYKTFAEYAVDLFRVTTSRLNYIYLADRKKCYKKLGHSEKARELLHIEIDHNNKIRLKQDDSYINEAERCRLMMLFKRKVKEDDSRTEETSSSSSDSDSSSSDSDDDG